MTDYDVVVVGGGAAGLLAATRAAERGLRTLLVEKNRKPGVKILMSGGSRCNLTQRTTPRGIVAAFGTQGRFLQSALATLGPDELVALVEAEGVRTKVEETGKIFPASNKAADVLQAFVGRLNRSGCAVHLSRAVTGLAPLPHGWQVDTSAGPVTTRFVVVAVGGRSYPGCGTTGDGYTWLATLGHTIVTPRPSLVPVTSGVPWIADLAGVTLPDIGLTVVAHDSPEGKPVETDARPPIDRGSLLFTHRGVSGPVVLNVSRGITARPDPQTLLLRCDFLPDVEPTELDRQLRDRCSKAGRKVLSGLLDDLLPQRLIESLLVQSGIPQEQRASDLTREQRTGLVGLLKRTRIPVSGTLGFEKAEVTAGGVSLHEVDSRTLQSRIHPGLYLAGEILDLDGPIGGYNFQAAFATAWLAAERLPTT